MDPTKAGRGTWHSTENLDCPYKFGTRGNPSRIWRSKPKHPISVQVPPHKWRWTSGWTSDSFFLALIFLCLYSLIFVRVGLHMNVLTCEIKYAFFAFFVSNCVQIFNIKDKHLISTALPPHKLTWRSDGVSDCEERLLVISLVCQIVAFLSRSIDVGGRFSCQGSKHLIFVRVTRCNWKTMFLNLELWLLWFDSLHIS